MMRKSYDDVGIKPKESNRNSIDEEEILFDMTDLSEIRKKVECPICLDIIRKTTITKCGHRFCKDCIEKSMRLGNHKCPSCRVHFPSRRSLRANEQFDRFISMMYPDGNQYEKEQEIELNETERIHSEQTKATISQTLKLQSEPTGSTRLAIVEAPRGTETIIRSIPFRGMRTVQRHEYSEGNNASCNYHVHVRGLTTSQPFDSKDKDGSAGHDHCVRVNPIKRSKNHKERATRLSLPQPSEQRIIILGEKGSEDSKEEYSGTNIRPLVLPRNLRWGRRSMRSNSIRKRYQQRNHMQEEMQMDIRGRGWYDMVTEVLPQSLKWGRSNMRSNNIRKKKLQKNRIKRLVASLKNLKRTQKEVDIQGRRWYGVVSYW